MKLWGSNLRAISWAPGVTGDAAHRVSPMRLSSIRILRSCRCQRGAGMTRLRGEWPERARPPSPGLLDHPPGVTYSLSPLGETIADSLMGLIAWAESHHSDVLAARRRWPRRYEPYQPVFRDLRHPWQGRQPSHQVAGLAVAKPRSGNSVDVP